MGWLNGFDVRIELYFSHLLGRHAWFDSLLIQTESTLLLKGGAIVFLVWFLLFDRKRPGQLREGFELLFGSVFFSLVATLVARCLALCLPFRVRPLATPWLQFHFPGDSTPMLTNWSSFPSDHAVMFFALASGIFMLSRWAGWFAYAWAAVVICFPRLYLGMHWPTDIVGGMLLGLAFAQFSRIPAVRQLIKRLVLEWRQSHPETFFPVLFLWSYETIVLFEDVRRVFRLMSHTL